MLMDILAAFAENPLKPAVWESVGEPPRISQQPAPLGWIEGKAGVHMIGHDSDDFAFDCEGPCHQILLHPYALANRLVTNGEWLRFMEAGGYERPELWLADGWTWVQENGVRSPLYWLQAEKGWTRFGLDGVKSLNLAEPVCHINYYEADAFARWAGVRLPTEAEWEVAAANHDPAAGNQLDKAGPVQPDTGNDLFGNVWQWTMNAFLPYPGFKPQEGIVGEYNGKFMCGQFVLKGASCATPRGHSRTSYRNFYYPHMRWQFAGLRLAKDM
jgi:ergothioneine biosynthesis protein EgtB